jgi:hypothetical protein
MLHNTATRELHRLAHSVIFNPHTAWPLSNEQIKRVWKSLAERGVTEESSGIIRYSPRLLGPIIRYISMNISYGLAVEQRTTAARPR